MAERVFDVDAAQVRSLAGPFNKSNKVRFILGIGGDKENAEFSSIHLNSNLNSSPRELTNS